MALISRAIANLFNGVSQQPATLRAPNQAEEQENVYSAVATGAGKRPSATYVAKLSATPSGTAAVHWINRDTTERYEVRIRSGSIEVYNILTGAAQTVSTPSGLAYLTSTNPAADFALVTVADFTFIVNRTVTTAMLAYVGVPPAVTGSRQVFSALPAGTASGNIYLIVGDNSNSFGNYYVQDTVGSVYREILKPGLVHTLDPATMPHRLIRTGVGTFTFEAITWDARSAGDDLTAPLPSFVGKKLNDIFFHRNRLGLLSGENAILSKAGSYYGMFPSTVTSVLDGDPVDKSSTTTDVSILKSAASFNSVLFFLGDVGQFQLVGGSDGSLTPKNAKLVQTTGFEAAGFVKPAKAGQTLFFAVPKSGFTGIREYYVDADAVNGDATEITAHVPKYISGNVTQLQSSTTQDAMVVLSSADTNSLWVYKYFYRDTQTKLQSSWSKFTFGADFAIVGATWIGTRLYIAADHTDGHFLYYMDVQPGVVDTGLPFHIRLDRRVSVTGSYDAGNDWTTWTIPYAYAGTLEVIRDGSWAIEEGNILTGWTRPSATTVRIAGNLSASPMVIGVPYSARYTFSQFFVKEGQEGKGAAIAGAVLKLRTLSINYSDTAYFRAEVSSPGRPTYVYPFTNKVLNTASATMGTLTLGEDAFRFPVVADSREVTITLINDSYLPSAWQSAEWEAEYTLRSRRI